ncbi:MAG: ribonuclease HIII [Mycoplasmataceae bacterium]|jgi:ribonuclease HIII|nr:ribonuclease HIII [Mycoplasmataceae bacterium]
MQIFTHTLNNYQLDKVTKLLEQYKVSNPGNKNLLYFYKVGKKTVSIFKTYKMMIQGPDADQYGKSLIDGANVQEIKKLSSNYIGCDEVGVGDYFGGLITCAVYLEKSNENTLRAIGVRDSKDLTDIQMIMMFPKLIKLVKYACLVYSPEKYNELIGKFKNTHAIKTCMHDKTIKQLVKKENLSGDVSVVMDQYASRETYYSYFKKLNIDNPYPITRFETKAENKYLAVAAASIIARVAFLKQIEDLSKQAHTRLLLGSSNPKIIGQAKQIYLNGGRPLLNKFVKIDFATTKKVV